MAWPTGNISLSNVDSGSDSISSARADIYEAFTKINLMINNGANIEANVSSLSSNLDLKDHYIWDSVAGGGPLVLGPLRVTGSIKPSSGVYTNTIDTYDTGTVEFGSNVTAPTDYFIFSRYTEKVYSGGNTGATTVTPNYTNGLFQTFTATGNFTLALPTNMPAGASLVLKITQDATGSRLLTANANYKFSAGIKTLSTAANSIDIITVFYDGTHYLCNLIKGYS